MTARRRPSAVIERHRYSPKTTRLHVAFRSGSRGYYEQVSPEQGAAFLAAESRGRVLADIKRQHPYQAQ